jgi:putative transposase
MVALQKGMGHPPRIPVLLPDEQRVVYFLTFCVAGRLPVLANDATFRALQTAVAEIISKWSVLAGILMPDHVHLLAAPSERELSPGLLSAALKRRIRRATAAQWHWQPGCFDRLLRRDESLEEKWSYVRENPVRAGLVESWQDWPYRIGFEL